MERITYGYVRVSSREQCEDRQLLALEKYKIKKTNIFIDKKSGKDFNRPNYKKLLKRLKRNDLLIVKSIDRLGRNYNDIIENWRTITKEIEADIIILDMPLLDTTKHKDLLGTLISDIVLQILSYVSENERDEIRQRQREGIYAAMKRGVKFGRPKKDCYNEFLCLVPMLEIGELTAKQAQKRLGISKTTFYRWLKELKETNS